MKILGIFLALLGWIIAVVGLSVISSTGGRLFLCILGIAITLTGILGVLNKAHLKEAIWKR